MKPKDQLIKKIEKKRMKPSVKGYRCPNVIKHSAIWPNKIGEGGCPKCHKKMEYVNVYSPYESAINEGLAEAISTIKSFMKGKVIVETSNLKKMSRYYCRQCGYYHESKSKIGIEHKMFGVIV